MCSLPGIPHGFYGRAVAHCAPAAEKRRGIVLGQLGLNEWLGGAVGTGNAALAARRHKQQFDNIPFAAIDSGQLAQGVTVQNLQPAFKCFQRTAVLQHDFLIPAIFA